MDKRQGQNGFGKHPENRNTKGAFKRGTIKKRMAEYGAMTMKELCLQDEDHDENETVHDIAMKNLIKAMKKGDLRSTETYLQYVEEKPKQSIGIENKITEALPDQTELKEDKEAYKQRLDSNQAAQDAHSDDIEGDKVESQGNNIQ